MVTILVALHFIGLGFSLQNRLYQKLCVRYASKDLTINMNDFVLLSVKLEEMFSEFDVVFKCIRLFKRLRF